MNKSDILKITEDYGLAPNKKFGQNFLINDTVIQKIADSCSPEGQRILEIGPGLGSISIPLAQKALSYTAVEIDSGFVRYLGDLFNPGSNAEIIHADFLKSDLEDRFDVIVSNLPYYCASEILFRIAKNFTAERILVMMQKEMAERIIAKPGSETYGALTVTLSYYFKSKVLFHIAGESFYPKPDVKSSFLELSRKPRYFTLPEDEEMFHLIVKSVFWGRRKTLLKSLTDSPHLEMKRDVVENILKHCGIKPEVRGEKLSLEEFINLTEGVINKQ
ncbi:MAG TPA: 16S rRNA (adenine(1518)-N(6)/adenine(1519)-N(6))-dimethyltransferase RsmA [Spirochaetota bacterium]|nr:16S rRNA (adenine(1518)-N(6)/adenine(1519)-N(6))-dimethyltransferase RsmA [Spirochaetota bacterium]HPS86842.1 16S rRNA (adenine(1518)-N(6)/adenine(1519)-N(6))-dimethyltransferase RsmA [Spirochaetota bacterium]